MHLLYQDKHIDYLRYYHTNSNNDFIFLIKQIKNSLLSNNPLLYI